MSALEAWVRYFLGTSLVIGVIAVASELPEDDKRRYIIPLVGFMVAHRILQPIVKAAIRPADTNTRDFE